LLAAIELDGIAPSVDLPQPAIIVAAASAAAANKCP
jgi:pimeloyl-ACP methyl ester carboxylesterase